MASRKLDPDLVHARRLASVFAAWASQLRGSDPTADDPLARLKIRQQVRQHWTLFAEGKLPVSSPERDQRTRERLLDACDAIAATSTVRLERTPDDWQPPNAVRDLGIEQATKLALTLFAAPVDPAEASRAQANHSAVTAYLEAKAAGKGKRGRQTVPQAAEALFRAMRVGTTWAVYKRSRARRK
jgi:hypothetical protein